MGFRINTNVTAMSALRNLNSTSDQYSSAINRLSTGMKINSAADDPAGLIISEKYKAQVGGLNRAIQNGQDSINFVKTAEGALSEVNSLLNDARTLAVASANTGTVSSAQIAANQSQLNSIVASIDRISTNTQFGTKKLLDGSAGTQATVTDATKVSALSIGGTFNGTTLAASSGATLTVTTAATQASIASKTYAFATTTMGSNSAFTINGVTFATNTADTVTQTVANINAASAQTGVSAAYTAGGAVTLTTAKFGSTQTINLTDASGVFASAAGYSTASGTDAAATLKIGSATVNFTGSKNGNDGLTLTDADGNNFRLTTAGNATTVANASVGQVVVGSSQFQIGAFSGQTASLSISSIATSNLGTTALAGGIKAIDLTTASGANTAIQAIDAAIDQISTTRGSLGNFQRNVLESNNRSLAVASENLSAANSSIRDTDVAQEMTNYTKLQILQQAGMSVLSQANSAPQAVLSLLR